MSTPPPPSPDSATSLTRIIRTTLSYNTNLMLAAIISLLLVILFVLLLHLYTRWFLLQSRRRSRRSVTVPHVIGSRLHHRFTIIDTSNSDHNHSNSKLGLPFSIIASLPLFVYNCDDNDRDYELECAICLSLFEDEEIGRKLPDCGHAFHVECIDMWLYSHSTCPICRASIQCNNHSRKTDQLEIEITDSELNLTESTNNNEIVQITEIDHETANVAEENDISSIGESFRKLLNNSNRSGGKIHPSVNVSDGELEA
ncbi:RING-H2 finger protein ATL2-like [Rutidosis leptorrhynchoides]|uniref:RING-H2 finger protein ATL2-like n=1 Tax=Rutidosis leptorrhynchoides TaxID=125765 RepID=UPI003A99C366